MPRKLNNEQEKEIEKLYSEGYSTLMLSKKFNVHHSAIGRCLKRRDKVVRTASEAGIIASQNDRSNLHKIPESAKNLTEEKAFILGVMCGDGYLHRSKRDSYQVGLQATDKDFVTEFAKCIECVYGVNSPLVIRPPRGVNCKPQWQARICSKAVFNDILMYNPFKTHIWSIPRDIAESSDEIKAKFLGGFFDSEGNVYAKQRRIHAVSVNLTGLIQIKQLLESMGIKSTIKSRKRMPHNHKTLHSVNIQDRKSVEIFHKFIRFSIQRKQDEVIKTVNSYKFWKTTRDDMEKILPLIDQLRAENLTYEEIGRKLGIGAATAWNRINKSQKLSENKN